MKKRTELMAPMDMQHQIAKRGAADLEAWLLGTKEIAHA